MLTLLIGSYAAAMGMIIIGRFFDGLHIYYLLSLAATALVAGVLILLVNCSRSLIMGIVTAAAVVFSILSEKLALKHIKESYYDKTVSDGD